MRSFANNIRTYNRDYSAVGRKSIIYNITSNWKNATITPSALVEPRGYGISREYTYIPGFTDISIVVNPGIYVWSNAIGTAALTIGAVTSGDSVTIINKGFIMGQGGSTSVGGPAISLSCNATIDNTSVLTATVTRAIISGTVLTVGTYLLTGSVVTGTFYPGMLITGNGIAEHTTIISFGTGTGGEGTYNLSTSNNIPVPIVVTGTAAGYIGGGGGAGTTSTTYGGGGAGGGNSNGGAAGGSEGQVGVAGGGNGGGGGRIFPGAGGTSTGAGGGAGGASGSVNYGFFGPPSGGGSQAGGIYGVGGSANLPGFFGGAYLAYHNCYTHIGQWTGGGGGGGWGASGGSSPMSYGPIVGGGYAGGKAVALNGYSVTWVNSDMTRVWGAVA